MNETPETMTAAQLQELSEAPELILQSLRRWRSDTDRNRWPKGSAHPELDRLYELDRRFEALEQLDAKRLKGQLAELNALEASAQQTSQTAEARIVDGLQEILNRLADETREAAVMIEAAQEQLEQAQDASRIAAAKQATEAERIYRALEDVLTASETVLTAAGDAGEADHTLDALAGKVCAARELCPDMEAPTLQTWEPPLEPDLQEEPLERLEAEQSQSHEDTKALEAQLKAAITSNCAEAIRYPQAPLEARSRPLSPTIQANAGPDLQEALQHFQPTPSRVIHTTARSADLQLENTPIAREQNALMNDLHSRMAQLQEPDPGLIRPAPPLNAPDLMPEPSERQHEHNAQILYEAYGEDADWKAYQGTPMPSWIQLPDHIRQHWIATAKAVYSHEWEWSA